MFVGHPPTLQRLWHLPADLVRTPLEELRSRHEVKLLSLPELLRLLKRRQRALDQVPGALRFGLWGLGLGARARVCRSQPWACVRVQISLPLSLSPLQVSRDRALAAKKLRLERREEVLWSNNDSTCSRSSR